MAMAPRAVILLLALLGASVCSTAVWADEVVTATSVEDVVTIAQPPLRGGVVADEESFPADSPHGEDASGEPVVAGVGEVGNSNGDGERRREVAAADPEADVNSGSGESGSAGRPLSRILTSQSSMTCWSTRTCEKFFKYPGCCKEKCVDLYNDSNNCGKCGNCCDTKKGYCCTSGKCVKPTAPSTQCGSVKKCASNETCCQGKCVNLKSDNNNCGKCNTACGYGNTCCSGTCKSIKQDARNCGACGKSCNYGQQCCSGTCKHIFSSDKANCGACGKKCSTTCKFGMCGYGH